MKTEPKEKTEVLQIETNAGQRLQSAILQQVIQQLGQPVGRSRVQIRKLWDDRYRVNIFTGPEVGADVIAHSFFLVTDDKGAIVAATPRITRQY